MSKEQILIDALNRFTTLIQNVENTIEELKFQRKLIIKETNDAIVALEKEEEVVEDKKDSKKTK